MAYLPREFQQGDGGVIKTLRRGELDSISLVNGVEVGPVSRFDAGTPKEKKIVCHVETWDGGRLVCLLASVLCIKFFK